MWSLDERNKTKDEVNYYYIGPVEKRAGMWGWYRGFVGCQPAFVAYGYITTKREAIKRREADIQEILDRGDSVALDHFVQNQKPANHAG